MNEKTYHIETFGCQMNERDSEEIRTVLESFSFSYVKDEEEADFVIYNTCTVRENANNRVWGRLGYLQTLKAKRPSMKIALCGCMMQDKKVIERIKKSYPFVDLVFGTHNLNAFPKLLEQTIQSDKPIIEIIDKEEPIEEGFYPKPKYSFKSGVNVMFGCNNFCSYCIVPYVRGRERSRRPEDILKEIRALAKDGITEVMLLGQNVNSYGKTLEQPVSFASLLKEVSKEEGIKRIRFMTSHPKDLSDELIEQIAGDDKICKHIHLPLQSGSTRILSAMNRKYTKDAYLDLVNRIKKAIPNVSITTDIIVGFPGETEDDFLETMDVVKKVQFSSAFTFIYSPRNNTPAAEMTQNASQEEIKDRFDRLLVAVKEESTSFAKRLEGSKQVVLVEKENRQDTAYVTGRMDNNMLVHLPGDASLIGSYIPVTLTESKGFYFLGEPNG